MMIKGIFPIKGYWALWVQSTRLRAGRPPQRTPAERGFAREIFLLSSMDLL